MSVTKRWCFTINNPDSTKEWFLEKWKDLITYIVMGDEVGDSGTPHIQGFVIFKSNKRLSTCKQLHRQAHWEPAMGNNKQASDYCKKGDKFVEWGEMPGDRGQDGGKANKQRYMTAVALAKEGRIDEIDADLMVRHYSAWKNIRTDFSNIPKAIDQDLQVGWWIYGESGTGKTHFVRNLLKDPNRIYLKGLNKWWDGYRAQDLVILEDVDRSHDWMYGHLKNWVDRWPFSAEQKGSTRLIRPRWVIITSNHHPMDVFANITQADKEAVMRRFQVVEWKWEMRDEPPFMLEKEDKTDTEVIPALIDLTCDEELSDDDDESIE